MPEWGLSNRDLSIPAGWTEEKRTAKTARFVNERRGLFIEIQAVFGGRARLLNKAPVHFRIQLRQD